MRRVIAVLLVATFATAALGIDSTSVAGQETRQSARDREQVARAVGRLRRGATVEIVRSDGTKISAVIQDIANDSLTVLTDERGHVETQTIAIDDIKNIKPVSLRKMSSLKRALIVTAVTMGIIVGVCAAILVNADA